MFNAKTFQLRCHSVTILRCRKHHVIPLPVLVCAQLKFGLPLFSCGCFSTADSPVKNIQYSVFRCCWRWHRHCLAKTYFQVNFRYGTAIKVNKVKLSQKCLQQCPLVDSSYPGQCLWFISKNSAKKTWSHRFISIYWVTLNYFTFSFSKKRILIVFFLYTQ